MESDSLFRSSIFLDWVVTESQLGVLWKYGKIFEIILSQYSFVLLEDSSKFFGSGEIRGSQRYFCFLNVVVVSLLQESLS